LEFVRGRFGGYAIRTVGFENLTDFMVGKILSWKVRKKEV
jgi:hypothetical protein